MKLAAYYVRHQKRISRPVMIPDVTGAFLRRFKDLKEAEDEHKDPSDKPTISEKNWSKTLEEVEEYLRNHLGHTKIPLAYVVRKEQDVPPHATDPQDGYPVIQDEMIRRAPHVNAAGQKTESFNIDNRHVWTLISELTRDHKCWTYVKPHQRARDGREAFLPLRKHYLGTNNVNNMASSAETKLQNTSYTKEGKRWNFESYVSLHKEQHQILQQLEDDHQYKGIDEGSKVRFLLAGIKMDKLNTIKAQILGDPLLQTNFDRCVDLFKAFLEQVANDRTQTFNVSRVDTRGDGKGRNNNGKGPKGKKWVRVKSKEGDGKDGKADNKRKFEDDEITDRYYSAKEYNAMTASQRAKVQKLRDERQRQAAAALTKLAEMEVKISQLQAARGEGVDGDNESINGRQPTGSNRNNAALQRKSRK